MKLLRVAICVVALVCMAAPAVMSGEIVAAKSRKAAPGFVLTDSAGATVKLSSYKGKVVLLDFWATWCGGCKVEIPWYIEFESKYKDSGLVVIGVSMDDGGWKLVKPFIAAKEMNYPAVIGDEALAKKYGLEAMPMTLLIDREGKIAVSHTGLVDKAGFESEVRAALREGSAGTVK